MYAFACGTFWFYKMNYITLHDKNNFKKWAKISPCLYTTASETWIKALIFLPQFVNWPIASHTNGRSGDRASWYILIKKQVDALISQIYFWNTTPHVSDSSSVHHQEFITVNTAIVYVTQVCWQLASSIRMSAHLYDTYHYCVCSEKLLMMDRGTLRNM